MRIFYIRCSTGEQNPARQEAAAKEIEADRIYKDINSGKTTDKRPQLAKMLEDVKEGDMVYCTEISRIARNTKDLLEIVDRLKSKGVSFVSLKEQFDTTTPQGKFMLTMFAAMSELEREYIRERQAEGIAAAKKEGKYKGRTPLKLNMKKFGKAIEEVRAGHRTARSVQAEFGIGKDTYYRRLKELEESSGTNPKKKTKETVPEREPEIPGQVDLFQKNDNIDDEYWNEAETTNDVEPDVYFDGQFHWPVEVLQQYPCIQDMNNGRVINLSKEDFLIGSDPKCDYVLENEVAKPKELIIKYSEKEKEWYAGTVWEEEWKILTKGKDIISVKKKDGLYLSDGDILYLEGVFKLAFRNPKES